MRAWAHWLQEPVAAGLVMFMAVAPGVQAQQPVPEQQPAAPAVQEAAPRTANPGTRQPPVEAPPALRNDPATVNPPASGAGQQLSDRLSSSEPQQSGPAEPVGTAAAPYEKPLGVAASRPAGAVVAPAKQRRTRSILIRVGLIVGAAAAIGTVIALSESSSSRPN